MKRFAVIVAVALAVAACDDDNNNGNPNNPSNTGPIVFNVTMRAAEETPPIQGAEANARGTATITFNVPRDASGNITGGGSATFNAQMSDFPAGAVVIRAHIHPGALGVAGGVLVDTLLTPGAPINLTNGTGSFTATNPNLTQTDATNIAANPAGFYFNVHSTANPNGAIRGQLVRQ